MQNKEKKADRASIADSDASVDLCR